MIELFASGDVDGLLPYLDPDVELRPHGMPREVYRGHEGVRQLYADSHEHGREAKLTIDQCVADGDRVAVLGRIRVRDRQLMADSSAAWVLELCGGKMTRSVSYRSHATALRAVHA